MSWNSKCKYNFFRTVKFRITSLFILLFSTVFFLLFLISYRLLKNSITQSVDERLAHSLSRLEERCLVADDKAYHSVEGKVPEKLLLRAENCITGLKIKQVKTEVINKSNYYVFLGTTDKMIYAIMIGVDGVLYRINGTFLAPKIKFMENEFENEASFYGTDRIYFLMIKPGGGIATSSDLETWGDIKNAPFPYEVTGKTLTFNFSTPYQTFPVRILNIRLPDGYILQAGYKLNEEKKFLNRIISIFTIAFLIVLLISILLSWLISSKAMHGVRRISEIACDIGENDLSTRIHIGDEGAEICELGNSFNEMLSRIELLVTEMKEVSDNIAHDLRTPLTRIRGILETTIRENSSLEDYRTMCGDIMEETDRLLAIINTMLEITQTDSGIITIKKEPFDINDTLKKAFALFFPLAAKKNINFKLKPTETPLIFHGDISRFQRIIANLLDNAIKYTDFNGEIALAVDKKERSIIITISDNGCGISEKDQLSVFERFFRCDTSRSLPGNGLGLSLAAALVKAHGGSISLESKLRKGTTVTLIFPSDNKNR